MATLWTAVLWYDDVQPEAHQATGLARLTQMYRGERPRLQGFLDALLEQIQSIEDVAFEVLTGMWPLTAVGEQLDLLGRIVLQERGGLTDPAYRVFILGRIFVNTADGTIPDFFELLADILEYEPVLAVEYWPATICICVAGVDYPTQTGSLLFDLRGAGIRLDYVYSSQAVGTVFRTSDTLGSDESTTTEGTANIGITTGGYLARFRIE